MRKDVRVVVLALLVGTSCLPDSCLDCEQDGDADCTTDFTTGGTDVPPVVGTPPAPLAVACESRGFGQDGELAWGLAIAGGTAPYGYSLDFGDGRAAETGSWSGQGLAPRGVHPYDRPGDYQFTAQVRDAGGRAQSCVLAHNVPVPDLELRCTATPLSGTAPLTVTFDAPPGSRRGCIGPCEVTWDFGDGQTHTGGRVTHTYALPGPSAFSTYAAFARLSDGLDRSTQCRRPIEVLPNPADPPSSNRPPSVDTIDATPSSITAGESATISGTTSDPDPGDMVTWSLSFDTAGAGTLSPSSGTGPILSTYASSPSIAGAVVIRVAAVDLAGAVTYRPVHVQVAASQANRPPDIVGLSASPGVVLPGGPPSRIQATVTDPDGDPVTWTLALDPSSSASGTFTVTSGSGNIDSSFSGTTMGNAVIRATASDGRGGTVTRTVTVVVVLG